MKGSNGPIHHVLFDLGNVLVPLELDRALKRLAPHLPRDRADLLRSDRSAFIDLFREPTASLETGEIDFDLFYRIMERVLGMEMNRNDFLQFWCDMFRLDEDMVRLGEALSKSYGTWLMSNTSKVHYDWVLAQYPRIAFFRGAALSYELGVMKPADTYYEKAMELFAIDPRQGVFIDDREENVEGARRAGLHGIIFESHARTVGELERLGVSIPS